MTNAPFVWNIIYLAVQSGTNLIQEDCHPRTWKKDWFDRFLFYVQYKIPFHLISKEIHISFKHDKWLSEKKNNLWPEVQNLNTFYNFWDKGQSWYTELHTVQIACVLPFNYRANSLLETQTKVPSSHTRLGDKDYLLVSEFPFIHYYLNRTLSQVNFVYWTIIYGFLVEQM